jgi:hypothetical protein
MFAPQNRRVCASVHGVEAWWAFEASACGDEGGRRLYVIGKDGTGCAGSRLHVRSSECCGVRVNYG